ncbi:MAG: 30S ribosomal protein S12 methylthiotransferase RimO [Frisingicoccus sp.]|uniref:30S ribosomal protein S12 methylthiotransferase RimO n=1 Tax=Frisingicoccus sp. TaxID=1918627 RepID=UPI002A811302|nr:30S ribosomal protein S12 methylthiotransferase RimO [Frisingicoccus sp.]MDY4834953.1 30S ribosomal protein S12 methylthiotransferase RimO [Frisingicoccus sp.]
MKILFVSLGCDKNLVDSEVMLGLLRDRHHVITNDEAEAEVIVVNTCSFIHDAREESIQTILEMAELKKSGQCRLLIVTGCLAEKYKDEILEELPEVDAVVGTTAYDRICDVIDRSLEGERVQSFESIDRLPLVNTRRVLTTGGYSSYLKIGEGCDKHCTYCIIPKLRGNYRSVPLENVLKDARQLAESGVTEINIVAQETTTWGKDIYGEKRFPMLLKELCKVEGIRWIRLLYCYPEEITDELIQVIKEEPKICHYLDMPIQHSSDAILKRMGRRTSRQELEDIIGKLRREIPDIALRTTLITGFPGETEEDHENLKSFVETMGFDRLGVFTYSPEEGTPAERMPDQVPEEVKEERRDELMLLQQQISAEKTEQMVGKNLDVLVEGRIPEEGIYVGRTYRDAPEVDGYIFINAEEEIISGDFVTVKVTGADEYDLTGDVIYEFTE